MYHVYVLKSERTERVYIGRTSNLKQRLAQHFAGKVWTTKRMLPVKLVFFETFLSKADAVRRERYFKTSKGKSTLRLMLRESLK